MEPTDEHKKMVSMPAKRKAVKRTSLSDRQASHSGSRNSATRHTQQNRARSSEQEKDANRNLGSGYANLNFPSTAIAIKKINSISLINTGIGQQQFLSESQTLKLIQYLLTLLQSSKSFKDTNQWLTGTPCHEVLTFLAKEVENNIGHHYWGIAQDEEGQFQVYAGLVYEECAPTMLPADSLPFLHNKNRKAKELLIKGFALLFHRCNVMDWNGYYEDMALNYFEEVIDEHELYQKGKGLQQYEEIDHEYCAKLKHAVRCYKKGSAAHYLKRIHQSEITAEQLEADLDSYHPKKKAYQSLKNWLQHVCRISRQSMSLWDFMQNDFDPKESGGLHHTETLKLVYSFYDAVFDEIELYMQSTYDNEGYFCPEKIIKVNDLSKDYSVSFFPYQLQQVIDEGADVIKELRKH